MSIATTDYKVPGQINILNWPYLKTYILDARLKIENNLVENAIRPFALGKKNWLFSSSVEGAEASGAIYSILETAKLNFHEPSHYLKYIIDHLPNCEKVDDFEMLLPINLKPSVANQGLVLH